MADDAAHIISIVEPLCDAGEEIVLIAHSYGGAPASEALRELSAAARAKAGKKGGVTKVLYIAAVVPAVGASVGETAASAGFPDYLIPAEDYMSLEPRGAGAATFSDLPPAEQLKWAGQMPEHSTASYMGPLTYPGYTDAEVGYVLCEEDLVVAPALQEQVVEAMRTGHGVDVKVTRLKSGHVPQISRLGEMVDVVRDFAGLESDVNWLSLHTGIKKP